MFKCLRCGRWFTPKTLGQTQCEICRNQKDEFPPEPLDLFLSINQIGALYGYSAGAQWKLE